MEKDFILSQQSTDQLLDVALALWARSVSTDYNREEQEAYRQQAVLASLEYVNSDRGEPQKLGTPSINRAAIVEELVGCIDELFELARNSAFSPKQQEDIRQQAEKAALHYAKIDTDLRPESNVVPVPTATLDYLMSSRVND